MKAEQELDLIGSRLSILAKGLGMTQEEIATRLKISRITINRFFKGRTEIRSGDLNQLLQLFGIDVGQLLDERIERLVKGKSIHAVREHSEASRVLEDLDPNVSRTIVDQINWWRSAGQKRLSEHG
jgi:transcriptional regulator with XRE-family HTH domain